MASKMRSLKREILRVHPRGVKTVKLSDIRRKTMIARHSKPGAK